VKKLNELKKEQTAVIASINGDTRFVSRITSIGITPGCKITIIKNEKHRPLLVYSRDTMIALNRNECENIMVQPADAEGGAA
jgi:ferrous iron transport protein A